MGGSVISLTPEELDKDLAIFEGYVKELTAISEEILAITFGAGGGNESAGPCSGQANDLNQILHDVCVNVSSVIDQSTVHLKNIRDDIIASQGG